MPTVTFEGDAASLLWSNIENHLHFLSYVRDLESQDDLARRTAEVAMVAFMVTAAWGYNAVSDAQYGDRLGRFMHLSNLNNDVYKLYKSDSNVIVNVKCNTAGVRSFELGRAAGFSGVLPLTPDGFLHYCMNRKAMTELTEGDIIPSPYLPHSIRFVLITALVDFRVLPFYLGGVRRFSGEAHELLGVMGKQIGQFLPPLHLWQEDGVVYAQPRTGKHLPTILCPLSGQGMGENLLRTGGFVPTGDDKMKNRVWAIDFDDINGLKKSDEYLKKLFKLNRFIDRFRR